MTALNWEKDKARRMTKERSFDDLPPVGSFQDQIRCGAHSWSKAQRGRFAESSGSLTISNRASDFDQLHRYLQHALHPDFKRRVESQKAETIRIIKKLIIRCEAWGRGVPKGELALLAKAQSVIQKLAH